MRTNQTLAIRRGFPSQHETLFLSDPKHLLEDTFMIDSFYLATDIVFVSPYRQICRCQARNMASACALRPQYHLVYIL